MPSCQRPLPHRFQGWQSWCTCYAMLGIWEDYATNEPHSVVYVVLVWSLIDSKCLYLQCSFSSFKSLACLKLDTGWYWKNTGRSESGCLGRCDTASWYSRYIMAHLHIVKRHSKNQRNLYKHICKLEPSANLYGLIMGLRTKMIHSSKRLSQLLAFRSPARKTTWVPYVTSWKLHDNTLYMYIRSVHPLYNFYNGPS